MECCAWPENPESGGESREAHYRGIVTQFSPINYIAHIIKKPTKNLWIFILIMKWHLMMFCLFGVHSFLQTWHTFWFRWYFMFLLWWVIFLHHTRKYAIHDLWSHCSRSSFHFLYIPACLWLSGVVDFALPSATSGRLRWHSSHVQIVSDNGTFTLIWYFFDGWTIVLFTYLKSTFFESPRHFGLLITCWYIFHFAPTYDHFRKNWMIFWFV